MPTEDARRSRSMNVLSFGIKQGEFSNQRANKRQREETEDPNSAVIVSQASTATMTEKIANTNPNLLSLFSVQTYHRNTDALATNSTD